MADGVKPKVCAMQNAKESGCNAAVTPLYNMQHKSLVAMQQ
jgi:hypothetical protein